MLYQDAEVIARWCRPEDLRLRRAGVFAFYGGLDCPALPWRPSHHWRFLSRHKTPSCAGWRREGEGANLATRASQPCCRGYGGRHPSGSPLGSGGKWRSAPPLALARVTRTTSTALGRGGGDGIHHQAGNRGCRVAPWLGSHTTLRTTQHEAGLPWLPTIPSRMRVANVFRLSDLCPGVSARVYMNPKTDNSCK